VVFSVGSIPRLYQEDQRSKSRVVCSQQLEDRPVGGRRRKPPLAEAWNPRCCKPLRSNAELVVRESLASKDVKTEAEEVTVLEAVIRQPVKRQQTEKA
jgi:hypothetical protein